MEQKYCLTEQSIREAMERVEKQGPCMMHGAGYAAHRLVDSEMGAFNAGEKLEVVVDWFHREGSVEEMLSRWIAVAVLQQYGGYAEGSESCTYPPCQELPPGELHLCSKGELRGARIMRHPDGCDCGGFDRNGSHTADEYVGYCAQPRE